MAVDRPVRYLVGALVAGHSWNPMRCPEGAASEVEPPVAVEAWYVAALYVAVRPTVVGSWFVVGMQTEAYS